MVGGVHSGVQWSCCRPCYLPHQPPLSASLLVQLSSEDAPVVLAQSKSCDTLAPRLLLPVTLAPHLPLPVCACLRLQWGHGDYEYNEMGMAITRFKSRMPHAAS